MCLFLLLSVPNFLKSMRSFAVKYTCISLIDMFLDFMVNFCIIYRFSRL